MKVDEGNGRYEAEPGACSVAGNAALDLGPLTASIGVSGVIARGGRAVAEEEFQAFNVPVQCKLMHVMSLVLF